MKNSFFLYILCFCFSAFWMSCEKADQTQSQYAQKIQKVNQRTILDECEDCPIGCCCCGIERVDPTNGFTVEICGLCEGDYHCPQYSPGSPCSTFSGLGKNVIFTISHVKEIICIAPGASFRVYNPSVGTTIYFRFSCQYDVTNPTFVNVSLLPGEAKFYHNDGSCISEGPC